MDICFSHAIIFYCVRYLDTKEISGGGFLVSDIIRDLRRRIYQLGVPYIVFTLLLALFYGILQYISEGTFDVVYFYLLKIVTLQGIDSLWFIPCYFVAEAMMKLSLCVSKIVYTGFIVLIGVCLLFLLRDDMSFVWWIRLFIKFCICYTFVYIGYCISKYKIVESMKIKYAIMIFIIASYLTLYNGFSAIGSLSLNNPILYYYNAVCLTVSVFYFFLHIAD